MQSSYQCRGKLWKWPGGKAAWYFIILPVGLSREIKAVDAGPQRHGFGSLRVEATVGKTTWKTSIFPSNHFKAYLLPVKAAVRKAETLLEGKSISLSLVVNRRA